MDEPQWRGMRGVGSGTSRLEVERQLGWAAVVQTAAVCVEATCSTRRSGKSRLLQLASRSLALLFSPSISSLPLSFSFSLLPSSFLSFFLSLSLSFSLSVHASPFLFSLSLSLSLSRSLPAFVALFLIHPLLCVLLFPRPIHPSRSTFPSFSYPIVSPRASVRGRAFLSPRVSPSSSYGLQLPGRVTAGFRIRASTSSTLSCGTFYQEFQCHVSSSGDRSVWLVACSLCRLFRCSTVSSPVSSNV